MSHGLPGSSNSSPLPLPVNMTPFPTVPPYTSLLPHQQACSQRAAESLQPNCTCIVTKTGYSSFLFCSFHPVGVGSKWGTASTECGFVRRKIALNLKTWRLSYRLLFYRYKTISYFCGSEKCEDALMAVNVTSHLLENCFCACGGRWRNWSLIWLHSLYQ